MSKERPILFSAPMVRAILAGNKTQTRRIAKNLPKIMLPGVVKIRCELHPFSQTALAGTPAQAIAGPDRLSWVAEDWSGNAIGVEEVDWLRCPYGQPCDRLWVRESWWQWGGWDHGFDGDECNWVGFDHKAAIAYQADSEKPKPLESGWREWRGRPSIHMPRKHSRILLEVVSVRVERLQDISDDDAEAEGIYTHNGGHDVDCTHQYPYPGDEYCPFGCGSWSPPETYRRLWESINGEGSWDANPWVWVIEFRRVDGHAVV